MATGYYCEIKPIYAMSDWIKDLILACVFGLATAVYFYVVVRYMAPIEDVLNRQAHSDNVPAILYNPRLWELGFALAGFHTGFGTTWSWKLLTKLKNKLLDGWLVGCMIVLFIFLAQFMAACGMGILGIGLVICIVQLIRALRARNA